MQTSYFNHKANEGANKNPPLTYNGMKKEVKTREELGQALKELREHKGFTHYAAAKQYSKAKITLARIKMFESSDTTMNAETLINYLNDMGARLIIEWDDKKNREALCEE